MIGSEKYGCQIEEGEILIGHPTYLSVQTIWSKAIAPEKLQKTSNLEEQEMPEARQEGALQWRQRYDEEGDEKNLSKSRRTEPSG